MVMDVNYFTPLPRHVSGGRRRKGEGDAWEEHAKKRQPHIGMTLFGMVLSKLGVLAQGSSSTFRSLIVRATQGR